MRYRLLACSCLLVVVSAGGVKTLAASPDCARWVREYQQGLAKRAALAKKHVVHAARHLGVPRPKMVQASLPAHRLRPAKLTPAEMLKRFRVLCGEDLPDDIPASFVPTNLDAMMIPPAIFPDAAPLTDFGQPVSFVPTPAVVAPGTPVTGAPTNTGGVPGFGFPGTVGGLTPGVPGVPPTSTTTPIPVVVSPVPEPGSLILLLTGALGAVPILARRRRA
ncbi:MAG: PEP-CTERM sorting domain-containing protein [Janthinobacterium lividum]